MARQSKVADQVARSLMKSIADKGLAPGDHLAAEHELIEQLGVSRGSVREGMRLLEAMGVIELRRGGGGGAVVARPDARILLSPLCMLLQFDGASFGTVLEAIAAIQPAAAALAAQRRTDEQRDHLRQLLADLAATVDDALAFRRGNAMLGSAIGVASGNALLAAMMTNASWISMAIAWDVPIRRRRLVVEDQRAIVDAIADQDAAGATAAVMALMSNTEQMRSRNAAAFDSRIVWLYLDEVLDEFQLDDQWR